MSDPRSNLPIPTEDSDPMTRCPSWCDVDHATTPDDRHRGATRIVPVVLEGRGAPGVQDADLVIEVSRADGDAAVWVYLGDGWTGFSLSLDAAARLCIALTSALGDAGTLEVTGL